MLERSIDENAKSDHLHADAPRELDAFLNSVMIGAYNACWKENKGAFKVSKNPPQPKAELNRKSAQ